MNQILKINFELLSIAFLTVICISYKCNSQTIGTSIGWGHLGHSKLSGFVVQGEIKKNIFGHFILGARYQLAHASGSRELIYSENSKYVISDPKQPDTYYDPESTPPGLGPENEFITTFNLQPDRTTQVSYGILAGFKMNHKNCLTELLFSPSFVSIHKKYVVTATNGDFTNAIGTFEDVNLLSVFINDYTDVSLLLQFTYSLFNTLNVRPGLALQIEYLTSGTWNYGVSLHLDIGTD